MKNISYLLLACLLVFSVSCKDDDITTRNRHVEEVRNVQLEPTNGGAELSWELPPGAIGVRIVYIAPSAQYPFFPERISKMFPPEITSFEIIDTFIDMSEQNILVQAVFYPNIWSDGVQLRFNPYLPFAPRVRSPFVHYRANDVLVTWEMPQVPDDMTLLGFRVVYSLRDDGNYTEVELLYDEIEGFTLEYAFEVPYDIDVVLVRIYAIYIDDEENNRISRDVPIMVVMLEPVPIENIVVENRPGGARIYWDAPEGRPDLQGVNVVFQYGPGGRFFELWRPAGAHNFVELEGYSNTQPHMVALYARFGRGDYRTEVTIQPEAMLWHGQINFDMPGITRVIANQQRLVLWEQKDWGNSEHDVVWHNEVYQYRTALRGELFVPTNRRGSRGFQHVYTWTSGTGAENQWNAGGDDAREFNLEHFLEGTIGNTSGPPNLPPPAPFPLYVTFDMGRRAWHHSFAFLVRERAGGAAFPTYFRVWGTNEITPYDAFGSRIESLEYWTNWQVAGINGTDAWKNGWTLLAENQFEWPDGPIAAGITHGGVTHPPQVWPIGRNANQALGNYGTSTSRSMFRGTNGPALRPNASFLPATGGSRRDGFMFSLNNAGAQGSYRFLRLEILEMSIMNFGTNGDGQLVTPNLQMHALKFFGRYDEYWP